MKLIILAITILMTLSSCAAKVKRAKSVYIKADFYSEDAGVCSFPISALGGGNRSLILKANVVTCDKSSFPRTVRLDVYINGKHGKCLLEQFNGDATYFQIDPLLTVSTQAGQCPKVQISGGDGDGAWSHNIDWNKAKVSIMGN